MEPTYYATTPANVRYDDRLSMGARLLYGEITALSNKTGYCWATNGYFAKLYKVHDDTISEWIRQLVQCGHVGTSQFKKGRRIHLVGSAKTPRGVGENAGHNNTDNISVSKDTEARPFDLKEILRGWEDDSLPGHKRDFDLIAWFVREKGLTPANRPQLNKIVGENIKAAKKLAELQYKDSQIVDAGRRAKSITAEWTLNTVLKIIK